MISQRYEFMRRFKFKRQKFEEKLKLKIKYKLEKTQSENRKKISKFFHSKNNQFLSQYLKPLEDHPIFGNLTSNLKTSKDKMTKIDTDFDSCISNYILSDKELLRLKKKNFFMKKNYNKMPKGSTINSFEASLQALRKLHNQSRLSEMVEDGKTAPSSLVQLEYQSPRKLINTERKLTRKSKSKRKTYLTSTKDKNRTKSFRNSSYKGSLTKLPLFQISKHSVWERGAKSQRLMKDKLRKMRISDGRRVDTEVE